MSLRKEYQALRKMLKDQQEHFDRTAKDFYKRREADYSKCREVARQIIFSEKLLQLPHWSLVTYSGRIFLRAAETSDVNRLKPLVELTETDYHSRFDLCIDEDGKALAEIRYSDGEITLHFANKEYLHTFTQMHGIKIDTSTIDQDIKNLSETLEQLQRVRALTGN